MCARACWPCWPCWPRRAVGARCGRSLTTSLLVVTGRARWFARDRRWIDRRSRPRPPPFGVRSGPGWGGGAAAHQNGRMQRGVRKPRRWREHAGTGSCPSAGQPGGLLHRAHKTPACCLTTRLAVGAPASRCPSTLHPHGPSPTWGHVLPRRGQHGHAEPLRAKNAAAVSNQPDGFLPLSPRSGGPAIASTQVAKAGSRSRPFAAVRPPARTTGRLPRQAGTGPSTAGTRAT